MRRRLILERLSDRRVLAAITGTVFEDLNSSIQRDAGEVGAAERLVYIDANSNGSLDAGEPIQLTGEDGGFAFQDLSDGTYSVRLFNGTQSQRQTTPVSTSVRGEVVSVADGSDFALDDSSALVLTSSTLVSGDLDSGSSTAINVGDNLTGMEVLSDGTVLVVANESSGDSAWLVEPGSSDVTPIDLSGASISIPWAELALDGNGQGVLIEQAGADSVVRSLDATDPANIQVTETSSMVPAGTQVLSSDTGARTVFAWAGSDGLQLSLWSNSTASFITSTPIDVDATTELLAFDDASGLLALRTAGGGVSVHDVDANFATLHEVSGADGPVEIDGPRDLLLTLSPAEAALRLFNLRDGEEIADLAVDLSSVGQAAKLSVASEDSIAILGAAGLAEIALDRPEAHEITIADDVDPDAVLFGVAFEGDNSAPGYDSLPELNVNEDDVLMLAAPGAMQGSSDADGDSYVAILTSPTSDGTVAVAFDGAMLYTPNPNFNGTDNFSILLHDGRAPSDPVELEINVTPVPDSPTGVNVTIDPVPEGIPIGTTIGSIDVIDVDGGGHLIDIDEPRFGIDGGGNIIYLGGGLDFEGEPTIPITVTVTDSETDDEIEETLAVSIRDGNDPITAITPTTAVLFENSPGDIVTELFVHDEDEEQLHTLTVDDSRFTVQGFDLRLRPGIAVDFETEPEIIVNVTATEVPNGGTFTQAITITVRDRLEQPQQVGLSEGTVMELVAGAVVGDVTVDSQPPDSRFTATVDDSRFEVSEGALKLLDDVFVNRDEQEEIQLTITVSDSQGQFTAVSNTFIIEVLENETPFHNHSNPYDVDHGGDVTSADALAIINYLNAFGPGPVGQGTSTNCLDVNADGFVTVLDALLVINEMNRQNAPNAVGGEDQRFSGGEGEMIAGSDESAEGEASPESLALSDKIVGGMESSGGDVADVRLDDSDDSEKFAQNVDATLRLLSDEADETV